MNKTIEELLKEELKDNENLGKDKAWIEKLDILHSEYFNNDEFLELSIKDDCKSIYELTETYRFKTYSSPELYNKKVAELFLLLYFQLYEVDNPISILTECINDWEKSYERSKLNRNRRRNN